MDLIEFSENHKSFECNTLLFSPAVQPLIILALIYYRFLFFMYKFCRTIVLYWFIGVEEAFNVWSGKETRTERERERVWERKSEGMVFLF